MISDILASPANDSDPVTLADWLELTAFFDQYHQARIDQIVAARKILEEEQGEDIGEIDAEKERLREEIEAEIKDRLKSLEDAYPFSLSEDGEVLTLLSDDRTRRGCFYIFCLIMSHASRSPILKLPPVDAELDRARKSLFQIFSTLAIAGEIVGHAISLGWPRDSGETILETVGRACSGSSTGVARKKPASTANPAAKDGGIDVLGWKPANDRPPPSYFVFGQAASGHGWPKKSSKDEVAEFLQHYFDEHPACDHRHITVCPFRVDEETLRRKSMRHGTILDRTRAPLRAIQGYDLSKQGYQVDEVVKTRRIIRWLLRYRTSVLAAA